MKHRPRCDKCNGTSRYPMPSLKRFKRDENGKAVLDENGDPIMEMAFRCRGCGEIFYFSETPNLKNIPSGASPIVKAAQEHIAKKRAEAIANSELENSK